MALSFLLYGSYLFKLVMLYVSFFFLYLSVELCKNKKFSDAFLVPYTPVWRVFILTPILPPKCYLRLSGDLLRAVATIQK